MKKTNNKKTLSTKIKSLFIEDDDTNITFTLMEVTIIILISIVFGIIVGYIITYNRSEHNRNYHSREILEVYNNIVDNYYYEVDEDKLVDAAVEGMIGSLSDPYSYYMNKHNTEQFNESIDGYFVGIGVTVQYDKDTGNNTIIKVLDSSPAGKAGLKEGDILVKVNKTKLKGVYGDKLVKLIRGKAGSIVNITVKRGNKTKSYNVKRDIIELDSVSSKLLEENDQKIGYIRIDTFASNTYKQFNKQLKKLENKDMDSLIIDVRNNPGGHLNQARQILSLFFNKKTILYQIDNQKYKQKVYSLTKDTKDYKVAILINGESASASEVVASCFKENYKNGILIGEKTYGKGTVQKSKSLSTGTSIKYTTEKWLTSKGKWIEGKGIKPDHEVKQSDEYYEKPNYETDTQLQEALKLLKKES